MVKVPDFKINNLHTMHKEKAHKYKKYQLPAMPLSVHCAKTQGYANCVSLSIFDKDKNKINGIYKHTILLTHNGRTQICF